ncbi:MAG TPA: hypothetical protein VGS41_13640 [Chthonomonadales bacterium]|nr:hypothetical protein [Chthonomonadales bacterium]
MLRMWTPEAPLPGDSRTRLWLGVTGCALALLALWLCGTETHNRTRLRQRPPIAAALHIRARNGLPA